MKFKLQFGLRTVFLLVTVSAVITWWVVYNLDCINQRRSFLSVSGNAASWQPGSAPSAPWPLGWLGERGYSEVSVRVENQEGARLTQALWPDKMDSSTEDKHLSSADREKLAHVKQLFPEAKIRASFFVPPNPQ